VELQPASWSHGCGFCGTFKEVSQHERTCKFYSNEKKVNLPELSSLAATQEGLAHDVERRGEDPAQRDVDSGNRLSGKSAVLAKLAEDQDRSDERALSSFPAQLILAAAQPEVDVRPKERFSIKIVPTLTALAATKAALDRDQERLPAVSLGEEEMVGSYLEAVKGKLDQDRVRNAALERPALWSLAGAQKKLQADETRLAATA
jgi:hypothetical protein